MQQTQIKKVVTPTLVELLATFPSGSQCRFAMVAVPGGGFNIGYGYIKSRTPAKEKERREVLGKFFTPQPGEKPMQVAGRVEAFFRGAGSTTELVEAIKGGAELAKLAKEGGAA